MTPTALVIDLAAMDDRHRAGHGVHIRWSSANPDPKIRGLDVRASRHHYFLGRDAHAWILDVPSCGAVLYRDLWPSTDLRITCDGNALRLTAVGDCTAHIAVEVLGNPAQDGVRVRRDPDGRSVLLLLPAPEPLGGGPSRFIWSTLLGGEQEEDGYGVCLDALGAPIVVGQSASPYYPCTPGAYDVTFNGGFFDAVISKLDAQAQTLLWSTYLGGTADEWGLSAACDSADHVVITGCTASRDFPTTPGALQPDLGGAEDIFLTKLHHDGNALLWSTYLGGESKENGAALVLDDRERIYVAGWTLSPDFPVTAGGHDASHTGCGDMFLAKLAAAGDSLLAGTYYGGSLHEWCRFRMSILLDEAGCPVLAGPTCSPDIPTTVGAYDQELSETSDVIVARFEDSTLTLDWTTFLGGDGGERGISIVRDSAGRFVVAGRTSAADFPTTSQAFQEGFQGGLWDCFVAKLAADGTALAWATYLGGGTSEFLRATAIDESDCPIVIGFTYSPDFPTSPDAHNASHQGGADVFLARLAPDGEQLVYGTFLGGSDADDGWGMILTGDCEAIVTGATWSLDFPTSSGVYGQNYSGEGDIFLAKLEIGQDYAGIRPVADVTTGLWTTATCPGRAEIRFRLARSAEVALAVYDPNGRKIRNLLARSHRTAGLHRIVWSGCDGAGRPVGQGIYTIRLRTVGAPDQISRLLLIR